MSACQLEAHPVISFAVPSQNASGQRQFWGELFPAERPELGRLADRPRRQVQRPVWAPICRNGSVGPVQEPGLLAGHTVAIAIEVGTVAGRACSDWSRTRRTCCSTVWESATARHYSQHSRGRPRRATASMTVIVASFPVVVTPGRVEAARMRRGRRAHPSDRNDTGRHGPAELLHTSPLFKLRGAALPSLSLLCSRSQGSDSRKKHCLAIPLTRR
jgi:hypothetical protein